MTKFSYTDKNTLYEMYVEREMTQPEIADVFGVNHGTISYWMDKKGIEARPPKTPQLHAGYVECSQYGNKSGYWCWVSANKNSSADSVPVHRLLAVSEYGIEAVKDKVVHHKNGIPWDNRPDNIEPLTQEEHGEKHQRKTGVWDDEKYLREEYWDNRKSAYQIAKENNVSSATIYSRMKEYGIERRGDGRGNQT